MASYRRAVSAFTLAAFALLLAAAPGATARPLAAAPHAITPAAPARGESGLSKRSRMAQSNARSNRDRRCSVPTTPPLALA